MAASGWFSSWARVDAISPMVTRRAVNYLLLLLAGQFLGGACVR